MSDAVKIADLASRWVRVKAHAKALRKYRGTFYCERAEPGGLRLTEPITLDDGTVLQTATQDRPCWKMWVDSAWYWYERERLPEDEWCDSCRQRNVVHKLYTEAAKQRGIRNRALQAAARAWEPDLVARRSGGQQWPRAEESDSPTVAALVAAMRCHGWYPSVALPGELKGIASAVARARDRQTAKMLRVGAGTEPTLETRLILRRLADRIEAGAVDRE